MVVDGTLKSCKMHAEKSVMWFRKSRFLVYTVVFYKYLTIYC